MTTQVKDGTGDPFVAMHAAAASSHYAEGPFSTLLRKLPTPMGFLHETRQANSKVHVGEKTKTAKKVPRANRKATPVGHHSL